MHQPKRTEESLFEEALNQPTLEARAAFLNAACGGDAGLRGQIEKLLNAHDAPGSFLRPEPAATLDEPCRESAGDRIGPYKLLQQIGEGGMGVVFMAEQIEPVRRKVALKIIKPGMDSKQVIARFEAERQALAMMDHQNIARVLDGGATAAGGPYFVMELVHGVPLTQYCDDNKLSPAERLMLFVPVCQAIQHAHHKGVIHRDIKPSNVLVTMYDDKPVPKVIDFGVAKAVEQQLTERSLFTHFGAVVGTFEYMSPEQAEMNAFGVDTRSDVYSLGVLLYELLTGTTPFDRKRLQTAAFDEIRRIIREEEPPKPSTRLTTLGESLSDVSAKRKTEPGKLPALMKGDLDWIVMKALEKDRTRRYETATAFGADVLRHLRDDVVEARPPSTWYRLRKMARRNKAAMTTAALVAAALVLGIIGTSVGLVQARDAETQALRALEGEAHERRNALKNARLAEENAAEARHQKHLAVLDKKTAEANLSKAKWLLYAANITSAQREWESGKLQRVQHYLKECPVDYRGWEHAYLYTGTNLHEQILGRHKGDKDSGYITDVAFSSDGKFLASAADGGVKLWDVANRKEVRTFKGVWRCVAFSPDGRLLAAHGSGEKSVKLCEVATGKVLQTFRGHKGRFRSLAFSPDGKTLAAAEEFSGNDPNEAKDCEIILWEVDSGKEIHSLQGHRNSVMSLAFSPDGKHLVSASWDCTVNLWDLATGKESQSLEGHTKGVRSVAFHPGGKLVASASPDGTVKLWELASGKEVVTVTGENSYSWVAFSPDGKLLASAAMSGTVKLLDAATGKMLRILARQTHKAQSLAFSPDSSVIATGASDGEIALWELSRQAEVTIERTGGWVAFSPDSKFVASVVGEPAKSKGITKVWNSESGKEVLTFPAFDQLWLSNYPTSVAFSPSGELLAWPAVFGGVHLGDANTGVLLNTLKKPKGVHCVAFSPDGTLLACAGYLAKKDVEGTGDSEFQGCVTLRKVDTGQEFRTLMQGSSEPVVSVAFSPDGKRLATASGSSSGGGGGAKKAKLWGEVKLWDVATGKELRLLTGHTDGVNAVAFSPDGKLLASASRDKTVRLWDAATGAEVFVLSEHFAAVTSVAFGPDGKRLASACIDGTVRLWDVASSQHVLTLQGPDPDPKAKLPSRSVTCVAFSPDGKSLACAGRGSIRIWSAR